MTISTMPSVPFMSLFPSNYTLKVSGSGSGSAQPRRPDLHPLQKRVDDPEESFTDLVRALPLPPSLPSSSAPSPTSKMFENAAAMKSAPSLQLTARASSSGGHRRTPHEAAQRLPAPRALAKARSGSDLRSKAAPQAQLPAPQAHRTSSGRGTPRAQAHRSTRSRPTTPPRKDTAAFESVMESE